ncbi:hypothetical protein DL98DRAFT_594504 [Cadophora sp. DSE1049]|nr:hypothetical protein DL98DRAFT_594504 [Cadophora sp. DSE1049]
MKPESFLHPLRTRCKRRNGRHSPSGPIRLQPSLQPSPPSPSSASHIKSRQPHIDQDHHSRSDTNATIKAHFHCLIHSAKVQTCHSHPHSPSKTTDCCSSFTSSEKEQGFQEAQSQKPQLVYEHELIDGVVSDAERGEVCVVLEVGIASVVGVERVRWWEVAVVDLDLDSGVGVEGRGEREEIGRAF